jgi:hypothetical protein
MKTKLGFKIFVLFFCSLIFISATSAQEKPQALKFDEFDDVVENRFYSDRNELTFSERVKRFSKQLEKERGVWAYVIYYQARITHENLQWNFINQAKGIKNQIIYNDRIKIKDVAVVDGGYREKNSIEFWILPKNADAPTSTPTFDKSETFICPNIVIGDDTPINNFETVNLIVRAYNFEGIDNYSLIWKVSAGEIVEKGLDYIKVKLDDSAVKRITAFVEVSGLPFPCPKVFSTTVEIKGKLYLVDSFGLAANGDIKARVDSFMVSLQNNPTAKGYIIVYGNRSEGNRDAERRITMINNYFRFRNFDVSRITIMRGGFREEISTELWLSLDDAEKPVLTPTVDIKFIEMPAKTTKTRRRKK